MTRRPAPCYVQGSASSTSRRWSGCAVSERVNPFDQGLAAALEYDSWYESTPGRAMLDAEIACLRPLLDGALHPRIDIGTGTGRFGAALQADVGMDPARSMLTVAAERLPSVVEGAAEALPFRDASLESVLSVTVFEFLPDPVRALAEIARVLRPRGRVFLGLIQRGSPLAEAYREQGLDPASVFHRARYFHVEEIAAMSREAALRVLAVRSSLFGLTGQGQALRIEEGTHSDAGFVAVALEKDPPGGVR